MKVTLLALLISLTAASAAELLKATEFVGGKGAWQGPASVVYLSPDGKEQLAAGPDTTAVLRVSLSKSRWSVIEHRVRLGKKESAASLKLELQVSPDFQPLAESKEYTPEDLREGGEYSRPARVFSKAGLLIQLSDNGTWLYRPKGLQASSGWETVTASFDGLKAKQNETLALCLPPGDGHVDIKLVSFESR
jgi:hypothetical protein